MTKHLTLDMYRYLSLLLITSICLSDTLILKNKKVYKGELVKYDNNRIIFKALPSANLSINISDIQELKLSDGTKVFDNGIMVVNDLKSIEKYKYTKLIGRTFGCLIGTAFIIRILFDDEMGIIDWGLLF